METLGINKCQMADGPALSEAKGDVRHILAKIPPAAFHSNISATPCPYIHYLGLRGRRV